MAGPQDVVVRGPSGKHCCLVKALPANRLTRIPYFGPLFTYDLGKSPAWRLTVTYLGCEMNPGVYDIEAKPMESTWIIDIDMEIGGVPVGRSDDFNIDIKKTAFDGEAQVVTTKRVLETMGSAQLQIAEQAAYMFEVKEASGPVVNWAFALAGALIAVGVVFALGKF